QAEDGIRDGHVTGVQTCALPISFLHGHIEGNFKNLLADGAVQEISFDVPVEKSSWLAVRILGSSHTNPIFVLVDGKPIRASRERSEERRVGKEWIARWGRSCGGE